MVCVCVRAARCGVYICQSWCDMPWCSGNTVCGALVERRRREEEGGREGGRGEAKEAKEEEEEAGQPQK